ncbi:MAG: hypothetical protein O2894_05025 [Planctomycetota bacterium]|nr:hypothetical protein [Planctomycetota bacterium]
MQRLAMLLAVASLAGAAWWIAVRPAAPTVSAGLVVDVEILDRAGQPVTPAQVILVFGGARVTVDGAGRARINNVLLRAGDEPSAEAFAYALRPLSHYHALRRGELPSIQRQPDGSWHARYVLDAHGILRVHAEPVNLGRCRVYLERDEPLQRWEPVGDHAVVRPGSVIDFRIYPGWSHVPLRLQGDPDADGAIAVAARRLLVTAPSPGHTEQVRIVPEPAAPIAGVVRVGRGPAPPSLSGRVHVSLRGPDGTLTPLSTVAVDADGSFAVRDAGTGEYELVAELDFVPGSTRRLVPGGGYVEFETDAAARWAVLEHADFDARARPVTFQAMGAEGALHARPGYGRSIVALPAGSGTLTAWAEGTPTDVPRRAEAAFTAEAGEQLLLIEMEPVPDIAVRVRVAPEAWGAARSARVRAGGQSTTLLKGSREDVALAHVALADDAPLLVEIAWDDREAVVTRRWIRRADAEGSGEVTLDVAPERGGWLAIHGPAAPTRAAPLVLRLAPAGPGGHAPDAITCTRAGFAPLWRSEEAVRPGRYLVSDGADSAGTEVVIRAGETTTIERQVEDAR